MKRVKSFSAGNEYARIVFDDGTALVVREGDEWDNAVMRRELLQQLEQYKINRQDERRMRIRAETKVKQLIAHAEDVEKRLGDELHAHNKTLGKLDDATNEQVAAELEGCSVTIRVPSNDGEHTPNYVGPNTVAAAITSEHDLVIDPRHVRFKSTRELGVTDAEVHFGAHSATVKVWIVAEESQLETHPTLVDLLKEGQDCPNMLIELFTRVLRLVRTTADNADGEAVTLQQVINCCDKLLGE